MHKYTITILLIYYILIAIVKTYDVSRQFIIRPYFYHNNYFLQRIKFLSSIYAVSQRYWLKIHFSMLIYFGLSWNLLAYYVIALHLQSTVLHKNRATLWYLEHEVTRLTVPIAIYVTTHFYAGRFRRSFFRNFVDPRMRISTRENSKKHFKCNKKWFILTIFLLFLFN